MKSQLPLTLSVRKRRFQISIKFGIKGLHYMLETLFWL
jgi:hypothetical protein